MAGTAKTGSAFSGRCAEAGKEGNDHNEQETAVEYRQHEHIINGGFGRNAVFCVSIVDNLFRHHHRIADHTFIHCDADT